MRKYNKKQNIKNTIQLENYLLKYEKFTVDINFLKKLIEFNIQKMKKLYSL